MRGRRARLRRRAGAALFWGVVFFAAAQAALGRLQGHRRPELRDPEYGHRLVMLRQALAEKPGRPLVLVTGSSRVAMGLRPALIENWRVPTGEEPVVFNFGIPGSGPVRERLWLERLLADGIRPDRVVLEYWPPLLSAEVGDLETAWVESSSLSLKDLPLVYPYAARPFEMVRDWGLARMCPWYANRFTLLAYTAEGWLPPAYQSRGALTWRYLERFGWLPYAGGSIAPREHKRLVQLDRAHYGGILRRFDWSGPASRAMDDVLALCRREGIPTTLLWLPEAPSFRRWYSRPLRDDLKRHLDGLARTYGVRVVDARRWYGEEDFADAYHMLLSGTKKLTDRFGREVLPALFRPEESARRAGATPAPLTPAHLTTGPSSVARGPGAG